MEQVELAGSFSAWLRTAREQADHTRKELAYAVGVAPDTIKKYEEGKRRASGRVAHQLGRRLGVTDIAAFIAFARQSREAAAERRASVAVVADPFRAVPHCWNAGADRDRNGIVVRSIVDGWYRMEVIPSSAAGSGWGGGMFYPVSASFYAAVDVIQPEARPGNSCGLMFGAANNSSYHLFGLRGFSQEYLVTVCGMTSAGALSRMCCRPIID
jgi:transcriptional regulator with XRE-family HTH domain